MKAKDLRERTAADLVELEKSLAKDTFTARFKNFTNRLDDTSTIKKTKRDLARVKTLLREQKLTADAAAAGESNKAAPKAAAKSAAKPAKAKKASTKKTSEAK